MERIFGSAGLIAIAIALIIVSFIAIRPVNQWIKNQAFSDCAIIATFTTVTQGQADGQGYTTTSSEPIRSLYKTCIEDKGYETNVE